MNAYARALLRRFANASLQHRTLQIAMDGSQKIPVRWLPVLRHGLRQGLACPRLVTSIAVWFQFLTASTRLGGICRWTTRWPVACGRWRQPRVAIRPARYRRY